MHPFLALALLLAAAALALGAGCVVSGAARLARPPRMTDGKALHVLKRLDPGDLGLPFEARSFRAGGLRLAAWRVMRERAGGRAVVVHGYADAKVGALAWAPLLRELGLELVLVDLPAHGESDGRFCTGGDREGAALADVLRELDDGVPTFLFGVSLGAAACVVAAARGEAALAGVMCESPFPDWPTAVRRHGDLMGLPLAPLAPLVVRLADAWTGAAGRRVDLVARLSEVRAPVLLLHGALDPVVPPGDADKLRAALAARANPLDAAHLFTASGHVDALAREPEAYRAAVGAFVARALRATMRA